MRFFLLVLMVLNISACAIGTGVRPISFNGEKVFEAKCNGTARTYADCLVQASKTCSEYNQKAIPLNTDGSSTVMTNVNGQVLPIVNRSMLFKCE